MHQKEIEMIEADKVEGMVWENKHGLSKHEAICVERYNNMINRIVRLERIALGVAGAIIFLLVQIALKLPV